MRKRSSARASDRERLRGIERVLADLLGKFEIRRDLVLANVPPAWVHHVQLKARSMEQGCREKSFRLPAPCSRLNAFMKLLTIETTCDETAAAVITDQLEVLSSVVASQDALHQRFGGVVPEIASRAHVERILPVIDEALRKANITLADLDAVAVANTPGLAGSLLVGLTAAKTICLACDLPLLAVNHLQAHIYACRLASGRDVFPCVGLVVSGGHSNLYRCEGPTDFTPLGGTIDDAAGEAFDKVASLLGLPYPGGPSIEKAARTGDPRRHRFPRPAPGRPRPPRFQLQRPENGRPLPCCRNRKTRPRPAGRGSG